LLWRVMVAAFTSVLLQASFLVLNPFLLINAAVFALAK
jgi:hypothetical protein